MRRFVMTIFIDNWYNINTLHLLVLSINLSILSTLYSHFLKYIKQILLKEKPPSGKFDLL